MSRARTPVRETESGFPRVSGDEPLVKRVERVNAEFSPRERG